MKSYLLTVLVELTEVEMAFWSEGSDETFTLARKVNVQQSTNGVHLIEYREISNDNHHDKYGVLTEDGGI